MTSTNDEGSQNAQMMKAVLECFCNSDVVIPSSFVIRHFHHVYSRR